MSGWVGVDLDGTLAKYEGWKGIHHIGDPVPAMLKRVREWVQGGQEVKIFTARVSIPDPEKSEVITHIHDWCIKHGLPKLEVTCQKDFGMITLYDDRCIQVEMNTGRLIEP
jgi:hypothetical protein